jgi:hypothetical protein
MVPGGVSIRRSPDPATDGPTDDGIRHGGDNSYAKDAEPSADERSALPASQTFGPSKNESQKQWDESQKGLRVTGAPLRLEQDRLDYNNLHLGKLYRTD